MVTAEAPCFKEILVFSPREGDYGRNDNLGLEKLLAWMTDAHIEQRLDQMSQAQEH